MTCRFTARFLSLVAAALRRRREGFAAEYPPPAQPGTGQQLQPRCPYSILGKPGRAGRDPVAGGFETACNWCPDLAVPKSHHLLVALEKIIFLYMTGPINYRLFSISILLHWWNLIILIKYIRVYVYFSRTMIPEVKESWHKRSAAPVQV